MANFFKALKAGAAGFVEGIAEGEQPRTVSIAGRQVRCPHCSNYTFLPGHALLNSRGRTFFNLDWSDPTATLLICAECGRIEWFAQPVDVLPTPAEVDSRPPLDLSAIKEID